MHKVVISDASCLILLEKIHELDLLQKVYGQIITTNEVAQEFGEELPDWIQIEKPVDTKYQQILETQVDIGEASAICLAKEKEDVLIIIDDLKARKLAKKLELRITGTLGVVHKAKELNIIEKIRPIVDKLLLTNFRVSEKIVNELLRKNDEL